MRKFGSMVLALAGVALLAGPAAAQFGPRGGGPYSILFLLQDKQVQKELDLSEEDAAKIPEAVMEALAKSLKPEQLKRLNQLALQRRGNQAFADTKVQKELKISDDQKEKLDSILKDAGEAGRQIFQETRGNFEEMRKKMDELNGEVTKKIQELLTDEQRDKWKDMIGKRFKFQPPRFGRRPRTNR
jgi:hypothetical protein